MSTGNIQYKQEDVIIAFALVFGAGSATALGAAVVFVPKFVKYATNRKILASALGLSAGVMIYVSFIEIFQKSRKAFIDANIPENLAYVYATVCFFAGIIIMMLLNASVSYFLHSHQHNSNSNNQHHDHHHVSPALQENVAATAQQRRQQQQQTTPNTTTTRTTSSSTDNQQAIQQQQLPNCGCTSDDPIRDLEVLNQMADILIAEEEAEAQRIQQKKNDITNITKEPQQSQYLKPSNMGTTATGQRSMNTANVNVDNELEVVIPTDEGIGNEVGGSRRSSSSSCNTTDEENVVVADAASTTDAAAANVAGASAAEIAAQERRLLMQMSVNTAIAIGLHNFPEGLATFVATLHDPHVGVVLAIAIAIHNIPEGLCVALPIYYATGNRRTAFCWAILSGCSEPLAAVIGYIILANTFTSVTYGILFGIVAGMMVIISTRELLPTAHRYDPSDTVVTYSFIIGMLFLSLSLVLFVL